jgi:hypothetical protein
MKRFVVVTVLTAAAAFATLAADIGNRRVLKVTPEGEVSAVHSVLASAADGGNPRARGPQAGAASASSTNGGGTRTHVVNYESVRRTRRAAYALAFAAVLALLLIAFAIWRKIRSRTHGLT